MYLHSICNTQMVFRVSICTTYLCVFVSNDEKICLMVIIYNPSFICIYRYRHCGRYLHGLQYAKTTTMQVVVLTPHLSYSPLIHQYICLFTMSSFGSKSDPQQTTGALNCASICIFNIGIFALRSLEESQRRGESQRKSPLGRFPSWPNAAPRTFLDRVFGSQEGSNMIHGGTKKGVECSKIFYKMIKPPPPYMQREALCSKINY